jgi:hypothetical protein
MKIKMFYLTTTEGRGGENEEVAITTPENINHTRKY